MRRRDRAGRVVRGASAAGLATLVALLGHLLGGGALPGVAGILVPATLSLLVCTLLAGRRSSLPRLTGSVAASQLLFHALFVLGTPAADGSATTGHVHGAGLLPAAAPVAHAAGHDGPLMVAGHALAVVVTVAALRHGERLLVGLAALSGVVAAWAHRIRAVLGGVLPPAVPRTLSPVGNRVVRRPPPVLGRPTRRGPPGVRAA